MAQAAALSNPLPAQAQSCEFVLGFAELRALVGPQIVGDCLEAQRYVESGDAHQVTSGGLLVWRKGDNWTAFTDGARTWVNGPQGVQQRFNTERFAWEASAVPPRPPVAVNFDWYSASVNGVSPHGHHAAAVRAGDPVVVRLNAAATHDATLLISVELHDHGPDGYGAGREAARSKVWQMTNPAVSFQANRTVTLEERFNAPNLPPGRYRVHVGVFTQDWHHMIAWNDYAGFIDVR
jgi:hypothetical protein